MATNDFRDPQNLDEWMREMEKRMQRQERRLGGVIGGTISEEGTALRVPDPMAPIVPTDAPSESPEIHVQPSASGFTVVTGNVAPSTTIDYYVDTVLVRSTRSTVEFFNADAEGLPFTDETADHSFYVIARNEVGSAEPSNSVIARIDPTVDDEFVRAIVEAGFVLAGMIQVGNITIRPSESHPGAGDSGIQIPLSNGGLISLPSDGTPASFLRVVLQATQLLVEDKFELRGAQNRIAGALNLSTGVDVPVTGPTVQSVFPDPLLSTLGSSNYKGLADGGTFWGTGIRGGTGPSADCQVVAIMKDDGAVVLDAGSSTLGIDPATRQVWNYTKMGSQNYVMTAAYPTPGSFTVREFSTLWAFVREWAVPDYPNRRPETFANDGTDLYIGYSSTVSGDNSVMVLKVPATGTGYRVNRFLNPNFETSLSSWAIATTPGVATRTTAGGAQVGSYAARVETATQRTNLMPQPLHNVASDGTYGWSVGSGTASLSVDGSWMRINAAAGTTDRIIYANSGVFSGVTPGQQYFSAYDLGPVAAGTAYVGILTRFYDSGGIQLAQFSDYISGAAAGRKVFPAHAAPAGAALMAIFPYASVSGSAGADWFDIANVLVAKSGEASTAFSGSSGAGYYWEGMVNGSASLYQPATTIHYGQVPWIDVTAGLDYTFSAHVKAETTARSTLLYVEWYNSSGTYLGFAYSTATYDTVGSYSRFSLTATAPAGATKAYAEVRISAVPKAEYHYIDAVMWEQSSTLGTYFDGDTVTAGLVHAWTGTAGNSTSTELSATTLFTTASGVIPAGLSQQAMYVGSADFGAPRVVLTYSGGAVVWTTAGVRAPTQDWSGPAGATPNGLMWDTTTSRFFVLGYVALGAGSFLSSIWQLGSQVTSVAYSAAYSQYDNVAPTHETALSPAVPITIGARNLLKVITPAPQGTGNTDEPNTIRHYIQTGGAGSYYRQPDVTASPWTVLYTSPPATTGSTAPSVPDFTGVGNPGVIQSSKLDANGLPIWSMRGDGAVHMFPGEVRAFAGPGLNVPLGALRCDGTSYLRSLFPQLFSAITFTKVTDAASHPSGINTVYIADTSYLAVGMQVEATGIPAGATITAVTTNLSITISANTTAALAGATVRVLPHGAVDTTHFNVPDYRGRTLVGADGTPEFAGIGTKFGEKSHILTTSEMPSHAHTGATGSGGVHAHNIQRFVASGGTAGAGLSWQSAQFIIAAGFVENSTSHTHGIPAEGGGGGHNNIQPSAAIDWIIAW